MARLISRQMGLSPGDQETAQVAGMLHDIGKLLQLRLPGFYRKFAPGPVDHKRLMLEYNLLGASHAEIGAYLLGIWGLPGGVVESIAFHHRPDAQTQTCPDVLTALHLAEGLHRLLTIPDADEKAYLNMDYLAATDCIPIYNEAKELSRSYLNDQSAG
jgi:HD-like signal output (HDOD) protein